MPVSVTSITVGLRTNIFKIGLCIRRCIDRLLINVIFGNGKVLDNQFGKRGEPG